MDQPKKPKTGGRRKGTPNKLTVEKRKTIQALIPKGQDPLSLWMELLKHPDTPLEMRLAIARDVAPYVHPKLASIEARTGGKTHEQRLAELQGMASEDDE